MKKMKMMKLAVCMFLVITAFSACKKDPVYDPEKQLAADEELIKDFIAENDIPAIRDTTGVYYQIIEPGEGDVVYTANTTVTATYEGRFLDGSIFDDNTAIPFQLGNVIAGWQIGVPKIQKGGKIRLLVPSGYAYGPNPNNGMPPNAILDFDIELVDVQN